ncbi:hypothetical protein BC567DRAFT_21431 [Phyllosticta citribraziliensis]
MLSHYAILEAPVLMRITSMQESCSPIVRMDTCSQLRPIKGGPAVALIAKNRSGAHQAPPAPTTHRLRPPSTRPGGRFVTIPGVYYCNPISARTAWRVFTPRRPRQLAMQSKTLQPQLCEVMGTTPSCHLVPMSCNFKGRIATWWFRAHSTVALKSNDSSLSSSAVGYGGSSDFERY